MHYGVVSEYLEANISLTVMGDNGTSARLSFLIDTGFYGELTVSQSIVDRLNLPLSDDDGVELTLAGGSTHRSNVYTARIMWHDRLRHVEVVSLDSDFLIGMGLLSGSNVNIDAVHGGVVTINELPAAS